MSTIAAISTPNAVGGIAVIRISGDNAIGVAESIFSPYGGKKVADMAGYTCAYGLAHDNGERLDDCISAIYGELERLRDCTMDEDVLAAAKKQLKGQLAIASDNGESQALSMGKSLLVFGRVYDDETICRQIDAVTPQDIQASARAIFAPDRLSKLVYL